MKKILYVIFIALFFIACVVPAAGMVINGPSDAAANEIKATAPKLKNWDGTWNADFLPDLRDYMSDGFFLRLECITGWDTLCAKVLKTSANEDVILGPEGWLFYRTSADTYAGTDLLSERELWCCARSLYLMQEYVQSRGMQFLFVSPQGKETLYPEQMPKYAVVSETRNRESLQALMDDMGVRYGDLYTPYMEAAEQLCYSWDSHWNVKGAALGADIILSALGHESAFYDGPFTVAETHKGDLYEMLFPASDTLESDYAWADGFHFSYVTSFHSADDMTIQTANAQGQGSAFVYRDSSGRNLYPFLAEHYASAVFSRANNYNMLAALEAGANDVVVELADRNLNFILKYPGVYPAPVRDVSVLDGALQVSGQVECQSDDKTPDYVKLTGALPAQIAADSPVYVQIGGVVYEAMPDTQGFTAWLPQGVQSCSALMVYAFAEP